MKSRSIEGVAAGVAGDTLGLGPGVLPTVERTNRVNRTVLFAVVAGLDEGAYVRQFAACPAVNALAAAFFGNRQYCGDGSFRLGSPCVSIFVIHDRQCS